MNTPTLLLTLILSLHHFFHGYDAKSDCAPSSCGIIRNIRSPFHLKGAPKHCGDRRYELSCENNVTSLYLNSNKYHVRGINYNFSTIWLADVFMNTSICSLPMSLPMSSRFDYSNVSSLYPYSLMNTRNNEFITFLSCPYLFNASSLLIRLPDCGNSSDGRHAYMMAGQMRVVDVRYMCTVDFVALTSWNFTDLKNVSLSEMHQSLLYGFELEWGYYYIHRCVRRTFDFNGGLLTCSYHSNLDYYWERFMDSFTSYQGLIAGYLLVFMLIVAVLFAGVSIPAKIIIGFGASYWILVKYKYGHPKDLEMILVVSFGARFIIGILCAMGFLIYKFRRRHLSMYETIEHFLQSDNNLAPIRYSYSDIKKMTKGFREKLGEGGFGSVYKGKLRSDHDVAVKLLRKPTENSQDFMNEIATIGRIHHVNIVKLVGYCAERSKRALVFDFMSNGSLDKYIFSQEETNCLDWETKFNIAIEVARGVEYLHSGCDIQILHFDIKPHNILLDDKFEAKISDFGLAKLCSIEKDSVTMTAARGTIGYVAPELINRSFGRVSNKVDVYSYGMLLMEMVGLNQYETGKNDDSNKYFPFWIYDHFKQGKNIEIGKVEENFNANNGKIDSNGKLVRKMTIVALWCIQTNPMDRPSMSKILEMLEGEVERLQIPDYPSQPSHLEDESWGTFSTDDDSLSLLHYNNSISLENAYEDL